MAFATRLRAMMHHEIAAADVDGLLRGSGQLEDLRQQIEDRRRAGEIAHPGRPWETHHEMRFALAYFWVAQAFILVFRLRAGTERRPVATSGTGESREIWRWASS